ncbi:MAG: type II toxin-antitoxin system HipA family toxin YjjJ [Ghiorsea sp.]|nr:type II toxin-antitoxin system HipA family toxin YjjJ [Ghiorsea sp.]
MSLTIEQCLHAEPLSSKQLQDKTGLSQTVVARQLRELGKRIIKVSNGRPPLYALTANAFGADDNLLICMVDAYGHNTAVATLRPLAHGGFFVEERVGMPSLLLGEGKNGIYEDLPYFLYDLRPQGFLGRQIATGLAKQSADFPQNPERWNANHIGRYLVSNGDDLPGNLKFGQQAYHRVPRKIAATTPDDYPALAESVLAGEIPGSSAGGEQPKFTTYCGVQSTHVLVKFSPKGDDPIARRWKDILITEHYAAETLREAGIAAASETQLIEKEGRLFLESQRFDRSGKNGRLSMLSLQSIDAEFVGLGEGWFPVIFALHQANLISAQHVSETLYLSLFGLMINNTDMHLGNLSLGIDGDLFRLLPVYDMCSMGFAPKGGEATPFQFSLPSESQLKLSSLDINDTLEVALDTAGVFWKTTASDPRISPEFKSFLEKDNPLNQIKQALKPHLK